jgi:hypothetical protein
VISTRQPAQVSGWRLPLVFGCALTVGLLTIGIGEALAAGGGLGDLVVVDHQSGAVIRVDPATGT